MRFWKCTHMQARGIWATFSKGHFNKWKNAKDMQGQVTTLQLPFTYNRKSTNFSSTHVRICVKDITPLIFCMFLLFYAFFLLFGCYGFFTLLPLLWSWKKWLFRQFQNLGSLSRSFVHKLNLRRSRLDKYKSQVDLVFQFLGLYKIHHKIGYFWPICFIIGITYLPKIILKSLRRPLCLFKISISTTFQKFVSF